MFAGDSVDELKTYKLVCKKFKYIASELLSKRLKWFYYDGRETSLRVLIQLCDGIKKIEYKSCDAAFIIFPPFIEEVKFVDITGKIDIKSIPKTVKKVTVERNGEIILQENFF